MRPFSRLTLPTRPPLSQLLRSHVRLHPPVSPPTRPQPRFVQRYGSRPQYQRFGQANRLFEAFRRWQANPRFKYDALIIGGGLGSFVVYNTETVPVSGRWRFNCVPAEWEESIAKSTYQQVMQEYRRKVLSESDSRTRLVKRVLQRLIPASGLTEENWEVHVIDDPQTNAFVIPGGKVFVFSGILPVCGGEDGLAAVLGHEIAHNVAHHSAERMSLMLPVLGLTLLLAFVLNDVVGNSFYFSNYLVQALVNLPKSRNQESEADYIGLLMMAQSCYEPQAAVRLWANMERANKGEPPQFLSTHPSSHNRQDQIKSWLPEAESKRGESNCGATLEYADDFRKSFKQLRW
ncbi:hypothetical protein K402DRAFT_250861 [Aulographum hederae CBS 113979]|uniref:Peptidase M48 domain-containing protein n=1 Tax=Aulographum hederae CBS 113979 TaxID=1176131 RepID=A0A6G1GJZ2_9PEZI|nr:hypothetical protein K402DRAFT_250861 [Aulographum hederae CBS 113979]